jgi:hypothetical protein
MVLGQADVQEAGVFPRIQIKGTLNKAENIIAGRKQSLIKRNPSSVRPSAYGNGADKRRYIEICLLQGPPDLQDISISLIKPPYATWQNKMNDVRLS